MHKPLIWAEHLQGHTAHGHGGTYRTSARTVDRGHLFAFENAEYPGETTNCLAWRQTVVTPRVHHENQEAPDPVQDPKNVVRIKRDKQMERRNDETKTKANKLCSSF